MNKLKLSTRLTLLIGLLIAALASVGALGLYGINVSNTSLKSVYEDRTIPAAQLGDIKYLVLRNRFVLTEAAIEQSASANGARIAEVESNIASITKTWDAYMATTLTVDEERQAKAFAENRKRFVGEGLKPALAALGSGNQKEAERVVTQVLPALFEL